MPKKLSKHPFPSSSTSTINTTSSSSSGPGPATGSGSGSGSGSTGATAATSTSTSASAPPAPTGLLSILTDDQPLPRLMVFDLDYTLWPFWVDTHVSPPLKAAPASTATASSTLSSSASSTSGAVPHVSSATDRYGEHYAFYADVPRILYSLPLAGVRLAVASRTHTPELARELLKILHVPPPVLGEDVLAGAAGKKEKPRRALDFFDGGLEIYPSSKIRHLEAIARRTGIAYADMLFFDDEARNRDTESLGVTMWLVRDGMTWNEVARGVAEWRRRRGFARREARGEP